MERKTWLRPAANGEGSIFFCLYQDEHIEKKRAIIQIVHGMMSSCSRYIPLAEYLASRGFVVVMQDLQGHGRSGLTPGYFGPEDGFRYMCHDLHRLTLQAKKWYPSLPVIMFGHSMGSVLVREYAVRFPSDIDAMILSGATGQSYKYRAALSVMAAEKKIHGDKAVIDKYAKIMVAECNRFITDPVNDYAFCSTDPAVCIDHMKESGGIRFTVGGYYDLLKGVITVGSQDWADAVPDIPVYFFAGGADPIGGYGIGPTEAWGWLRSGSHKDCTLRIYPGKRHEMLNETNKAEVLQDLMAWIDARF